MVTSNYYGSPQPLEQWVVERNGEVIGTWDDESSARAYAFDWPNVRVVRLVESPPPPPRKVPVVRECGGGWSVRVNAYRNVELIHGGIVRDTLGPRTCAALTAALQAADADGCETVPTEEPKR